MSPRGQRSAPSDWRESWFKSLVWLHIVARLRFISAHTLTLISRADKVWRCTVLYNAWPRYLKILSRNGRIFDPTNYPDPAGFPLFGEIRLRLDCWIGSALITASTTQHYSLCRYMQPVDCLTDVAPTVGAAASRSMIRPRFDVHNGRFTVIRKWGICR